MKHNRVKLFEQFIEEMAIGDHHVQRILKYMETLKEDPEELARCKEIITGNPDASDQRVLDDIQEMGYRDIRDVEKEIFGNNQ
jgi:hypothetical protein